MSADEAPLYIRTRVTCDSCTKPKNGLWLVYKIPVVAGVQLARTHKKSPLLLSRTQTQKRPLK